MNRQVIEAAIGRETSDNWCITKVFDADDQRYVGTIGPRTATLRTVEAIKSHPQAKRFRLCCDDHPEPGNVMAEGYFVGDDEFAPLSDFGEGNWGCTIIEYWETGKGGGWKRL